MLERDFKDGLTAEAVHLLRVANKVHNDPLCADGDIVNQQKRFYTVMKSAPKTHQSTHRHPDPRITSARTRTKRESFADIKVLAFVLQPPTNSMLS